MEPRAKWNPCNSSETWHSLRLQQTGNTDESRKCSAKCKWTCSSLFSGPQIRSGWDFGFQRNHLDPSITSTIHPWCQDLSVSHQANARAVRERPEKPREAEGGWVGGVLIPALFLLLTASWMSRGKKKMEVRGICCFPLSSRNRSGGCLFYLAGAPAASTHRWCLTRQASHMQESNSTSNITHVNTFA